jgi:adenosine deaminase
VTVNPDNRLMSGTTLTRELALLCEAFDYGLDDVCRFELNAAGSVFAPYETRMDLAERIVGWAA